MGCGNSTAAVRKGEQPPSLAELNSTLTYPKGRTTAAVHQPQRVRMRVGKPPPPLRKLDKLAATLTYPDAGSDVEKCEEYYWKYGDGEFNNLELSAPAGSGYYFFRRTASLSEALKHLRENQDSYDAQLAIERKKNTRAHQKAEGVRPSILKKLDKLAATLTYPEARSHVEKCEEHYWKYGEGKGNRLELSATSGRFIGHSASSLSEALKYLRENQDSYDTQAAAQLAAEREKNTQARQKADGVRPPPLKKLDKLAATLTYPDVGSDVEKCEEYYWKYGDGEFNNLELSAPAGSGYYFFRRTASLSEALKHLRENQDSYDAQLAIERKKNTRADQKAEGVRPSILKKLDKLAATLTYPEARSHVEKCEEHYWKYGEGKGDRLELSAPAGSGYYFSRRTTSLSAALKHLRENQDGYDAQLAIEREKNTRAHQKADGLRPPPLQKLDKLAATLKYPDAGSDVEKCEEYYWKYGDGEGNNLELSAPAGSGYYFFRRTASLSAALKHLRENQDRYDAQLATERDKNTRARQKAQAYEDVYLV